MERKKENEMNEHAVVVKNNSRTKLAPYGSSTEVEILARRILLSRKIKLSGGGSRPLTPVESARMASLCIAHGLDYETDVDPMVDQDGETRFILKREALTKAAHRALEKAGGGNFWFEDRQITDPDERLRLNILPGEIAYETKIFDTPSIREYSMSVERLSNAGATWAEITATLGSRPYVSALGSYAPSVKTQKQDAKWNPHERAKKRAHCAALRIKYNLPFDEYADGADDLPDDYKPQRNSHTTIIQENGPGSAPSSDDYMPTDAEIVETQRQLDEKRKRDKEALYGE